ncbi:hypothetical protein N7495_002880 [Penicillium taxi]|uniref:uncharacterized protein n=1 Tax=Penicillium taxi TaxID=168475 RepID=UPI0025456887|nr:uncharacterized protein N7495_002880 [Penicillium taxi]KAJ5902352.1 hypothetical protein N7495_002880 [Penicillium taxi]
MKSIGQNQPIFTEYLVPWKYFFSRMRGCRRHKEVDRGETTLNGLRARWLQCTSSKGDFARISLVHLFVRLDALASVFHPPRTSFFEDPCPSRRAISRWAIYTNVIKKAELQGEVYGVELPPLSMDLMAEEKKMFATVGDNIDNM